MPVAKVDWTPELSEQVWAKYLAGSSYSEIASEIEGATRNSIAGFVNRVKADLDPGTTLPTRPERLSKRAISKATKARAKKKNPTKSVRPAPKLKPQSKPFVFGNGSATVCAPQPVNRQGVFLPAFAPKGTLFVTLVDLEAHHCKWPFDTDQGQRFCGCPRVELSEAEIRARNLLRLKGKMPKRIPPYCAHHAQIACEK